jgi:hypothetical protein
MTKAIETLRGMIGSSSSTAIVEPPLTSAKE